MEHITLYQLQMLVDNAIRNGLNSTYWVVAEISELKVNNNGHCYMELVEKGENTYQPKAKARAVIWSAKFGVINSYFKEAASFDLRNGIKVLVCVRVSFHPVYGLSYVVENIDPTYTLGDIEKQRQQTIKQLKDDGVFDMNKSCEVDEVIQNIAVISSSTAAGYTDFMKELLDNKFGYKFNVEMFSAVVQGDAAQDSLIDALNRVYEYSETVSGFDAVVIIRGGGSTSDLSCFDSYEVAYVAAQFPIAIFTGIGHEKDISVVDMVAYKSLKTPTAVAQHIVEMAHGFELKIDGALSGITERAVEVLNEQKHIISQYGSELHSLSAVAISQTRLNIERLVHRLDFGAITLFSNQSKVLSDKINILKNCLERGFEYEKNRAQNYKKRVEHIATDRINKSYFDLELMSSAIENFNPQRILNLGYSIVTSGSGAIGGIDDIQESGHISIVCRDGKVTGNIINIKKENNGNRKERDIL